MAKKKKALGSYPKSPAELLGEYILRANPYKEKKSDPAPKNIEVMLAETEKENYTADYSGEWHFKKGSNRIARALRIPYCYEDAEGQEVRDYILVAYEGPGPG